MLLCFFELNLQRIANPWVITGLVIMVIAIIIAFSANYLAKLIENIMIAKNKPITVNLKMIIKITALVIALVGALTAVLLV